MSSIASCRCRLQFGFVLSRGLARQDGMLRSSRRAYFGYKFQSHPDDPMAFVAGLSDADRQTLKECMQSYEVDRVEKLVEKPSNRKLKLVMLQAALPFIGFGFFDNLIMITAGEYIDATIGVAFGISTMAAAGLGNTLSDFTGIGLSHFVERTCRRLGLPNPNLTAAEARYHTVKWMILVGKCCGIVLGCVIGMSPLLFINRHS